MSVRTYLEREGTKGATRAMGAPLALCPMRNIMAGEYFCYARVRVCMRGCLRACVVSGWVMPWVACLCVGVDGWARARKQWVRRCVPPSPPPPRPSAHPPSHCCAVHPLLLPLLLPPSQDVQPEQRTPAAQRTCWGQQESLAGLRRVRPLFGRVVTSAATGDRSGCNYAIGHYDFGLVDTLPPEQAAHTLVVVNLREPTQRVLSSYYYMRKLGLGLMCPAGPDACLPILNFTRDGFQGG